MKKLIKIALFASSLAALNACGSNEKAEQSETAGASSEGFEFNMGRYLQGQGILSVTEAKDVKYPNKGLIKSSSDGLWIGGEKSVAVVSNAIFKMDSKAVSAQAYTDGRLFNKPYRALEFLARADITNAEFQASYRFLGDPKSIVQSDSELNYRFTRDIAYTHPFSAIPLIQLNLGAKVGGEFSGQIKPIIDVKARTAVIQFSPTAKIYGSITAEAKIVFAAASVEGAVDILNGKMPIQGGMALVKGSVKPVLKLEPLTINALSGNVDLKASLSVGNVLPGSLRNIWIKVVGDGLTWKHSLLRWEGYELVKTKGYDYVSGR